MIVYNLTRFAREKYDHFALRAFLKSLGISLRSATELIDDTSTGKLMEGVLAAFAQFDNDVRAERTRAGMRAALEQGRWTFVPPLGYLNAPKWAGKSLIADPERGELVKRAFEEFATGRRTKGARQGHSSWTSHENRPEAESTKLRSHAHEPAVRRLHSRPGIRRLAARRFRPARQRRDVLSRASGHRRTRADDRTAQAKPAGLPTEGARSLRGVRPTVDGELVEGRSSRYAYYHCWRQCRAVNIPKTKLEGLFIDELKELQPNPGFMRLVKEHVLRAWEQRKTEVCRDVDEIERREKAIQQKLDRLDEAFLFAQSIDIDTYDRHKDKLRQELTLLEIDDSRPGRKIRRRGHPGVRRARFTARLGPVGSSVARSTPAPAAAVFPQRSRVRWKTVCSNRCKHSGVQVLNLG